MKNKYMYIDSGLFQLEILRSDGKSKFMDFFGRGVFCSTGRNVLLNLIHTIS